MHVRWLTTLQSGREGSHAPSPHCPKFNQDWMMWKHQKETISYNTFTGCLGNKAAHRTPLLFGSAGTHGRTGGVIYGIWCVWIRFCSWLWQGVGVTVQNEWFLHICASKANVGPTWFVSVRRKDTKQTRRVNSLRRGSKRTGLVTFFFSVVFFFTWGRIFNTNATTALLQSLRKVWTLQLSQSIQFRSFFKSLFSNGT